MPYDPDSVLRSLAADAQSGLPPVHMWNPDCVQDIGMRITRDGTWYYQGSPINRERMVKLFSTILRRDGDEFFLVTPVEKVKVHVDLAPFIAIRMEKIIEADGPAVTFQTNTGDMVVVNRDHPLWVEEDDRGPVPLVRVRDRLDALLGRSVFYELAEAGTILTRAGREILGVFSRGDFYELGPVDE